MVATMSNPDMLQMLERRVIDALRANRTARSAYLLTRARLHLAIAERDALRGDHHLDGQAMTCEHGHPACNIGTTNCGDESC
jgi:hypothetical protein